MSESLTTIGTAFVKVITITRFVWFSKDKSEAKTRVLVRCGDAGISEIFG